MAKHRTLRSATAAVVALGALLPAPLAAAEDPALAFSAPAEGGVAKPGDTVPFAVTTAGSCDEVLVRAVVVADGQRLEGASATGCTGEVVLPVADGTSGAPIALRLEAEAGGHGAVRTLTTKRQEAEHAATTRAVAAEPTTDPLGGGRHLQVRSGDAVVVTGLDPAGISSLSVRVASAGGGRIEARVGAPDGPLLGAYNAAATGGWSSWLSVPVGLDQSVLPEGAFDLHLVFADRPYNPIQWPPPVPHVRDVPAVCGLPGVGTVVAECAGRHLFNLNNVDLVGHGVALPFAGPADETGFETIFDGTSLDGWQMAGPGRFVLTGDGAMHTEGGMGLLWYTRKTWGDFVLRAQFKVSTWRDNAGFFVRFPDPGNDPWVAVNEGYEIQIDDSFPSRQRTGSVYTFSDAEPLATNAVGQWNHLEVHVSAQAYRVLINGVEVTRYTGSRRTDGHIGVQNNDYFAGSKVFFRDIRVKDLAA